MNLATEYLGLKLKSPLVAGASPLSEHVDLIKELEDSGAAAVVLYSLFEEQLRLEQRDLDFVYNSSTDVHAEALDYFPETAFAHPGSEAYLRHIARAKESVRIPVIASLNGCSKGGWTDYASAIEQAGADALELNIYSVPTDPTLSSAQIEEEYLGILRAVKSVVNIPVAVKLSPFFTNFANMATRFEEAGAEGLVLFNRFYQPDIDLEQMELDPKVLLSTPMAMRLPLRWTAILKGRLGCNLAASGGIHRATDVVKMLIAGADVTMLCSVLLRRGIGHIKTLETELIQWLADHSCESVAAIKGSMSQKNCPDPAAFERAQYMRAVSADAGQFIHRL